MNSFYMVWGLGIFWLVFALILMAQGKPSDTQMIIANVYLAVSFLTTRA